MAGRRAAGTAVVRLACWALVLVIVMVAGPPPWLGALVASWFTAVLGLVLGPLVVLVLLGLVASALMGRRVLGAPLRFAGAVSVTLSRLVLGGLWFAHVNRPASPVAGGVSLLVTPAGGRRVEQVHFCRDLRVPVGSLVTCWGPRWHGVRHAWWLRRHGLDAVPVPARGVLGAVVTATMCLVFGLSRMLPT